MPMFLQMTSVAAACAALAACGGESTRDVLLGGSLGNAVREVGYSCPDVVEFTAMGSESNWRVSCGGAEVYVASVREDGAICVVPVVQGDLAPGAQPRPAGMRCTSDSPSPTADDDAAP